jgi:hypothetical protein
MKTNSMLAEFEEGEKVAGRCMAMKLDKAKSIYRQIISWEAALFATRDSILAGACELGDLLSDLKEEIGHGKWLLWLCSNFAELGKNDDMRRKQAERCINFARANPNWKNSSNFDLDSVRKFMWGYIPAKERLELEGDEKDPPGAHHLTFVNQFSKYYRQLRSGHVEFFSLEIFQREIEPMIRRIAELCGRDWVVKIVAEE